MNILIPDSWLREYLKTDATPAQIQKYLSLCGPSVERLIHQDNDYVYDIEVTTNRVDMMSVFGIAREAAAILPEFNLPARCGIIPTYDSKLPDRSLGLEIVNDPKLCRRILAIKLENVKITPSHPQVISRLEAVGQRPLNNVVDITNYVMWEAGHPIHAFDYDKIKSGKIIIRQAKKGESLVTLDGKKHIMLGGEMVFDDGEGTLIDLPSVMGTKNTIVDGDTRNVLLFIENSDPKLVRFASMSHSIRTQAAVVNEKEPDPETAKITIARAVKLLADLYSINPASRLVDLYPHPVKPVSVKVTQSRIDTYIGDRLEPKDIIRILKSLGFETKTDAKNKTGLYHVTPPIWRSRDIRLDVDIIEEIARIYGYHRIKSTLPGGSIPINTKSQNLVWEDEIKSKMRDWGYTEIYTYSMISPEMMDLTGQDPKFAYKITNPLSREWIYMRPQLFASILSVVSQNISYKDSLSLFELSQVYGFNGQLLPHTRQNLTVIWTGEKFQTAKGLAERIFEVFGIGFPARRSVADGRFSRTALDLSIFGTVGMVNPALLSKMGITGEVTALDLDFDELVKQANTQKTYIPLPKFPPAFENLALVIPENTFIGDVIAALKKAHPYVFDIILFDTYRNIRTLRVTYLDPDGNLTAQSIQAARRQILEQAAEKFGIHLKQ